MVLLLKVIKGIISTKFSRWAFTPSCFIYFLLFFENGNKTSIKIMGWHSKLLRVMMQKLGTIFSHTLKSNSCLLIHHIYHNLCPLSKGFMKAAKLLISICTLKSNSCLLIQPHVWHIVPPVQMNAGSCHNNSLYF